MGREPEDEPSAQDQLTQPWLDQRQEEPKAWSSHRRWLVLLSFSYFSFSNAVMIMDFATDYALSEALLGASQSDVALLYSLFLLSVMPAMFFTAYGVVHHNYATMAIGQSLNVLGAWLRYAAVINGSFPLALVSTVCAGASASVIVCSYAVIGQRWFRPSQRGLATTIAVQSNYAGWAMGSLIGLAVHADVGAYRCFALWQAAATSLCVPLFILGYRGAPRAAREQAAGRRLGLGLSLASTDGAAEPPPAAAHTAADVPARAQADAPADAPAAAAASDAVAGAHTGGGEARGGGAARGGLRLLGDVRYWVYACCYASLAGIGFAIPSAQDVVFGSQCYAPRHRGGGGGGGSSGRAAAAAVLAAVRGGGGLLEEGGDGFAGFDTAHTTFTDFTFIVVGVLCGLALGARVKEPRATERAVLALAALGSVAMTALAVLASPSVASSWQPDALYACLVLCMALSGAATVGFIGLALSLVVRIGAPVPEAYTVGGVEWLTQGVGGALSTLSAVCGVGFYACVALSWLATLVLLGAHLCYGGALSARPGLLEASPSAVSTASRQ